MSADAYLMIRAISRTETDADTLLDDSETIKRGYDVALLCADAAILTSEFASALASALANRGVNSVRLIDASPEVAKTLLRALGARGVRAWQR